MTGYLSPFPHIHLGLTSEDITKGELEGFSHCGLKCQHQGFYITSLVIGAAQANDSQLLFAHCRKKTQEWALGYLPGQRWRDQELGFSCNHLAFWGHRDRVGLQTLARVIRASKTQEPMFV